MMKVTAESQPLSDSIPSGDVAPPKNVASSPKSVSTEAGAGLIGGREFASVLENVAPARNPDEHRHDDERDERAGETHNRRSAADGARPERETREADETLNAINGSGQGFESRIIRPPDVPMNQEATANVRSILHIADLERIVAAVRAQTIANNRQEVTLQLRHAVLDGSSIRLSAGKSGRVDVEFIAASERVAAQLDARTLDLANLLRSRGINLAAVKTSIGGEASNQAGSGENKGYAQHAYSRPEEVKRIRQALSAETPLDGLGREHAANAPAAPDSPLTYLA